MKIVYNLRIEINQHYIYFILTKLDEPLEYIYKNKMDLTTIINKLELNPLKYSNLELIWKIIDNLYKRNKIYININDENSCALNNLLFKLTNTFDEDFMSDIKIYKEYMNNNDIIMINLMNYLVK